VNKIGIFGTSGFAREVADIAHELNYEPFFIARDEAELASWAFPEQAVLERDIATISDARFAIGIGENSIREALAKRYKESLSFINLIHPSASFGRGQREVIESHIGVVVGAGVRFTSNIQVGDFTVFNLNATVGHDVIVESFVNVAPGVNISGNVHIKQRCWIGTGAVINQGSGDRKLTIGADTTVGSGAVVIKDCDEQAVYVGAPAKRIK